jgi:hypothetical protein
MCTRCDLTRPCKTCSEREHPELCSYNPPPSKRINTGSDKDEMQLGGPGFVTIGRSELDMLFSKLNGLEQSMVQLKEELGSRRGERSALHDLDTNGGAAGYDAIGEGRVRRPTHTSMVYT